LKAEKNGEPVFVNGKQVGKTPFSGSVPLCAVVEVGKDREKVDVELEHNGRVEYTVEGGGGVSGGYFTDSRDGKKYKIVKIGTQTWMAENLNYNANGSKCYNNNPAYCEKYGRLYNWVTAKKACPAGWHLPNNKEWDALITVVGGEETAGRSLKATSAEICSYNGGTDTHGFAALLGSLGYPDGRFLNYPDGKFGYSGYWWSASEYNANYAYFQGMLSCSMSLSRYGKNNDDWNKNYLFSVRCVQN